MIPPSIPPQNAETAQNDPLQESAPLQEAESPEHSSYAASKENWSFIECLSFRFAFVYFLFYGYENTIGWIPFLGFLDKPNTALWHQVVPWFAKQFLHIPQITVFSNGSGDTTYDYSKALLILILASAVTLIWSILDRSRKNYSKLHAYFRIYISMVLAGVLISYGTCKLDQFPSPGEHTLNEPFGQLSPMGLLWSFMGYSRAYCLFAGLAEVLGGILILVPPLRTMGALVSACVMLNVFMLNMCYDIPVKLLSFHLLLMSLVLIIPECKRLANLFVFNRPVPSLPTVQFFKRAIFNKAVILFQILFLLYLLFPSVSSYYQYLSECDPNSGSPFYLGIWKVDEFKSTGGGSVSPSIEWKAITINFRYASLDTADGKSDWFSVEHKSKNKLVFLSYEDSQSKPAEFSCTHSQNGQLILDGTFKGIKFHATMHEEKRNIPPLMTRGFHWIQERPYNR